MFSLLFIMYNITRPRKEHETLSITTFSFPFPSYHRLVLPVLHIILYTCFCHPIIPLYLLHLPQWHRAAWRLWDGVMVRWWRSGQAQFSHWSALLDPPDPQPLYLGPVLDNGYHKVGQSGCVSACAHTHTRILFNF